MTAPTLDLTQTAIMTAVGNYLVALFPTLSIVQGQQNRTAEPAASDFIVFTPALRGRLGTNWTAWSASGQPNLLAIVTPTQLSIQADIHGPGSADNSQILAGLFRSASACDAFAQTGLALVPLYADDPLQLPFLNAEDQYEDRWTVNLVLQANPTVSPSQDFASTVQVTPEPIDA